MKNITVVLLVLSIIVNFVLAAKVFGGIGLFKDIQSQSEDVDFPYLSKRIFAQHQNDILINFVPLREKLMNYGQRTSTPVGIYFEYLPSGISIGVNEKETFFGASLLKLPTAMKIYKLIEEGQIKRDQKVKIEEENLDRGFGNLWQKGAGFEMTVAEAIKLAIAESDNTAERVLRDLIRSNNERPVSEVFDYLDIPTDVAEGPGGGVTAKNFSSVFRSLYFSAYISFHHSNELLEVMTTSPHVNRLVAGVPKNIKVAHKIGVYKEPGNDRAETHSDCGIVYVPKRPYILCVMTNSMIEGATKEISEVSKIVYDYVVSANH